MLAREVWEGCGTGSQTDFFLALLQKQHRTKESMKERSPQTYCVHLKPRFEYEQFMLHSWPMLFVIYNDNTWPIIFKGETRLKKVNSQSIKE